MSPPFLGATLRRKSGDSFPHSAERIILPISIPTIKEAIPTPAPVGVDSKYSLLSNHSFQCSFICDLLNPLAEILNART